MRPLGFGQRVCAAQRDAAPGLRLCWRSMVELVHGMARDDLPALSALEMRVLAADGGRLKLEWGVLRDRAGQGADDFLWWDGGQLLGFAGLYAFEPPVVEIAGMVD